MTKRTYLDSKLKFLVMAGSPKTHTGIPNRRKTQLFQVPREGGTVAYPVGAGGSH